MKLMPTGRRARLAGGGAALALVSVVASAFGGSALADRQPATATVTAEPSTVDIGPCLGGSTTITLANKRSKETYATVFVHPPQGATVSREMVSTYLPAGYQKQIGLNLTMPQGTTAGHYQLQLEQRPGQTIVVPVNVAIEPGQVCLRGAALTATATSAQTSASNGAEKAVDGNPATLWHTQWTPTKAALPQSITLGLNGTYDVSQLRYLPRTDGSMNGRVTEYVVEASADGESYTEVGRGTWEADTSGDVADIDAPGARFIRLNVLNGVGGYASAAELELIATHTS